MSSVASDFSYVYDVFLSFRGDTRYGFTKHLHEALVQNNVRAFMDAVNLDKGEEISDALLSAVEKSKIAIVIFSKEYASSTWCLGELVKIMECKNNSRMMVIPVFYNIDPAIVRKQTGPYGEAIAAHLQNYENDVQKVRRWCSALTEAGSISGWDTKDKYEADLIKSIVEDVSRKLKGQSENEVSDADDVMPLRHWFDLLAALGRFGLGTTPAESSSSSTVSTSSETGMNENDVTKKSNHNMAKAAASSTSHEETQDRGPDIFLTALSVLLLMERILFVKKEKLGLPKWVQSIDTGEWLCDVVHAELLRYSDVGKDIVQLLQLAVEYTASSSENRPSMSKVTKDVEKIRRQSLKR